MAPSEQEARTFPIISVGFFLNFLCYLCYSYCVCFLITIINVFHFIKFFFKNQSDLCETKTVLVFLSIFAIVALSFSICQACLEKKWGQYSNLKSQGPCKIENKKDCLKGGECYYLVDEDFVKCNCSCLFGGKRCGKYMWWTRLEFDKKKMKEFQY